MIGSGAGVTGLIRRFLEPAARERKGHPQIRARMRGRIDYSATDESCDGGKSIMKSGRDGRARGETRTAWRGTKQRSKRIAWRPTGDLTYLSDCRRSAQ